MNVKNIEIWFRKHQIHFVIWALFIAYESVIVGLYSGKFSNLGNYIIHYAINITLFYVHALLILPYALKERQKSFWRIPVFICLELLMYVIVIIFIDLILSDFTNIFDNKSLPINSHLFIAPIFRGSYFMGFSTGYYFQIQLLKKSKKVNELENIRLKNIIKTQRMEYELAKSQINPHFLFNTLDFIYHNTRKTSPVAADAIASLSNMMRFAIDNVNHGEIIPLYEEIEQIESLIQLYQIKKNFTLHIDFQYSEDVKNIKFIPLVLITLVENIFKHGKLTLAEHPALIRVYLNHDMLQVETDNLINNNNNKAGLHSGLNNISTRLTYYYDKQASFTYETVGEQFKVRISVHYDKPSVLL